MDAIVIVGLPASGKSTYIETIKDSAFVMDDFIRVEDLPSVEKLILADPYLCMDAFRQNILNALSRLGYKIELVFYENNPRQCLENAKTRPEKKVEGLIKLLSVEYHPPWIDRKVFDKQ